MKRVLFILLLTAMCLSSRAQLTVGTLLHNDTLSHDGYNLVYPFARADIYLTDNCGRVVHEWPDSSIWRMGPVAYLLSDGNLLKTKRYFDVSTDVIFAGGGGEYVELVDWDNNVLWSYRKNDSLYRLHHDAIPMPGGNILMTLWERKSYAECVAAGRDTSLLPDGEVWSELLLEVHPIGSDSFTVEWEWHAWDHLVQDYDSTKANFGRIKDHPELMNLNYVGTSIGKDDWLHFNALSYDPGLDQVIITIPMIDEVWIIDHSTTTAEAAGHAGGLGGKGGDLLWRWGNPMVYDRGDSSDIQLHFAHNGHFMDVTLPPSHPDFGGILLYNNRVSDSSSTVNEIAPVFDTYEWEYIMAGDSTFLPSTFSWTYPPAPSTELYSYILSGAQRLPNGNTLILEGSKGRVTEITPSFQKVFEYIIPLVNGAGIPQGDTVPLTLNSTFRYYRYPVNYGAFTGRTLTPGNYIELNPDTTACTFTVYTDEADVALSVKIYPNPVSDFFTLQGDGIRTAQVDICDVTGRVLLTAQATGEKTVVNAQSLRPGAYLVLLNGRFAGKLFKE